MTTHLEHPEPIAVTGATGYVAGWVVRELLARGHTVHGTARSVDDAKVGYLKTMAESHPGTLKLFAADLLAPGGFGPAFEGCRTVIHTASPFTLGRAKDPQRTLVEPALRGTENVLDAVDDTPSVERVVLTSSVVAVCGDNVECEQRGGTLNESHWNETSSLKHQPYAYSKTVAERRAWELHEAQDRWRLVTINPGFVMGPSIPPERSSGASVSWLRHMVDGTWRSGMFDVEASFVDVRDVARAHVEAALRADAEGRHIVTAESYSLYDAGQLMKARLGDRVRTPERVVPKWLSYPIGPLNGYSVKYVKLNVGHPLRFDNSRSRERLGMEYRPVQDTLVEHAEQWLEHGTR